MSDYSVVNEKAQLYDKAVELGILPADWDGESVPTPPATTASQHATREQPREKK
jgi:hypothetical protein